MKLSTREDIEAPIETVFAALSDFAAIERQLRARGFSVEPNPAGPEAGVGRKWHALASWRGRMHGVDAELVSLEAGRGYSVVSTSGGVVATTEVDLVALSKSRTRMLLSVDLRPTTLSSRLLVQSLKLAKGRLSVRLNARAGEFARRIEGRA
jgi:hypothetical protein